MPKPGEHKTVQSYVPKDAQEIGWTFVPRVEAESRRGFNPAGGSRSERVSANHISLAYFFVPLDFKPLNQNRKGVFFMEPVSVITGAIVTGAAAAAKGVGKQVVKDAYEGLKALVTRRFSEKEKPEGEMALVKIEEKPEGWEATLKETLVETGADKDEEIIRAAEKLVTALKSTPEGQEVIGKYNLNIKDSQVGVIGDRAEIKDGIHFGK